MTNGGKNQVSPPPGEATPRAATRNEPRLRVSRPLFSSKLTRGRNVRSSPVVLDWGSSDVIRAGFAEHCCPHHIIELAEHRFDNLERKLSAETFKSQGEGIILPIISEVFDRLMVDPSTRRVVVICQPYPTAVWETSVKRALWNLGVPAVAFFNLCEIIPLANRWKRCLVVNVGKEEAHILAHVDGHPLPYTYQGM